jgi:hypothetical protein
MKNTFYRNPNEIDKTFIYINTCKTFKVKIEFMKTIFLNPSMFVTFWCLDTNFYVILNFLLFYFINWVFTEYNLII